MEAVCCLPGTKDFTLIMSGNKKIVHFLSASDRLNYGDLLFPIIFKKMAAGQNIDFYNYGLVKSDLNSFGALPTESYKKLSENIHKLGGTTIIGGGEVFFADWNKLYSFINPFFKYLMDFSYPKRLLKRFRIAENLLSDKSTPIPFVLNSNKGNVIYHGVSGFLKSNQPNKEYIIENLKKAKILSLRDSISQKLIAEHVSSAYTVPDSAILMSNFFSLEYLESNISIDKNEIPEKYLYLQMANHKGPSNIDQFVSNLVLFAKKRNLKIIACPIGLASGHKDDIILKKIASLDNSIQYIKPTSIYDIMYLIANSKGFMGTSLHGLITAMSFNVPFIAFNKRVKKLDAYIKTWTSKNGSLDFEDWELVNNVYDNWNYKTYIEETAHQKTKSTESFNRIFKFINS
jgi:polysaccharide pyruvyl transferase WcaK-like protein